MNLKGSNAMAIEKSSKFGLSTMINGNYIT